MTRRTVLRGVGGATTACLALGLAGGTAAQSSGGSDLVGWFGNVDNYEGVVDETGNAEVTITVGTSANGGDFGFGPAAVRVDPGTTVVWEWSGKGGTHNVVAEDGSFESEMTGESGHTFEQTFESTGVVKYACVPHKSMGMKGAVVVGDADVDVGAGGSENASAESATGGPDYDGWFDDVGNYERTVDRTGEAEVTITVGADGNDGSVAFDPPAVRVDPGTTVVWEWSGDGGSHNVVAEDGTFESEMTGAAGHTFEQTFESTDIRKYVCVPHRAMGMKGAVVVGDPQSADEDDGLATTLTLGGGVGLVGGLVALFGFGTREKAKRRGPRPDR